MTDNLTVASNTQDQESAVRLKKTIQELVRRKRAGEDVDEEIHEFTNARISALLHLEADISKELVTYDLTQALAIYAATFDSRRPSETLDVILDGKFRFVDTLLDRVEGFNNNCDRGISAEQIKAAQKMYEEHTAEVKAPVLDFYGGEPHVK